MQPNVELLNQLADFLERDPAKHNQGLWAAIPTTLSGGMHTDFVDEEDRAHYVWVSEGSEDGANVIDAQSVSDLVFGLQGRDPVTCGTAACVAGWAVLFNLDRVGEGKCVKPSSGISDAAACLLDLDSDSADILFYQHRAVGTMPQLLRAIASGESVRDATIAVEELEEGDTLSDSEYV